MTAYITEYFKHRFSYIYIGGSEHHRYL